MKSALSNKEEMMWLTRVQKSLDWRAKYSFEGNWPIIDRYYRHKFENTDMPRFNLIYMMGQTLVPNLVFQSPGIVNTPVMPGLTYMASLWDSVDNHLIRHCELKEVAKEVVLSSYLHNTTATQTGYDFGTEADELRDTQQDAFGDVKHSVNRARAYNMPWVDFIPSHRFVVAVGTRTMRNCLWAAKLISVPTRLIKGKKGLKNVCGTKIPDEILRMEQATWEGKEKDKWTHFWQIHDAETKKWMWLGTHGKFILPPQDDPLQVFGLPFEVTSFNKNPDTIFGTPDAEYVRTQQVEGDEVRMHGMYMRRYSLPKFFYNSNVISPDEVVKMMYAQVGPAIPAKLGEGGDDDIRKHVYPMVPSTSNMLHREYAKDLLNDAQLINGFGPNQLGNFTGGRHTKYETQVVESNNTTRLAYRRHDVAQMIQGHIQRANMLIAENWTQPILEQVVGVDGALYWVKAGPEQLRGIKDGLTTEVNVESLAPVSRERRKMEAANLLGLIGNMQEAGMNTLPLIKTLLSAYEWIDVNRVLPQMSGEYELQEWEAQQQAALQKGEVGPRAAQNLSGLQSLTNQLPSEVSQNAGATNSEYPGTDSN